SEFFTRIGEPLTLKLILAFFFINGVTYVAFGLGHRIVRAVEWGDPVPPDRLASMIRRMRSASILNLLLAAWIVWVALQIPAGAAAPQRPPGTSRRNALRLVDAPGPRLYSFAARRQRRVRSIPRGGSLDVRRTEP